MLDAAELGKVGVVKKTALPGGLTPEAVGDIVTRAGNCAGLGINFTGHSPRRMWGVGQFSGSLVVTVSPYCQAPKVPVLAPTMIWRSSPSLRSPRMKTLVLPPRVTSWVSYCHEVLAVQWPRVNGRQGLQQRPRPRVPATAGRPPHDSGEE
uniref:hypothetical protein n=1 Tax=Streptomyces rimosus TaxID=1927 RepID=UPI002175AA30|nr:hypothetical protein [Streptomyces rimosus]